MSTWHLVIHGEVQGVFFRASAKEVADELGLMGWVRNTAEGDVEIKISGDEAQLKKFIQWCDHGPKGAHVHSMDTNQIEDEPFKGFKVIRG
jgi:acylphosphatase